MLVPGAWHAGWSWRPVAERLRGAGYRAITLTLPGMGDGEDPSGFKLQDAVDYIVKAVQGVQLDEDVVLVAHSWGGIPTSGAAHLLGGRLSKVIYYNGHVPLPGKSLNDENPPDKREFALRSIDESPVGAIPASLKYVEQELMQGVAPELQRLVADLLTLQPGGYFTDSLDINARELGMPVVYLAGDSDRAMPRPPAETAARLGVKPIVVPGTHNGMLTHPQEIAQAILAA
ncbi:alpha/beta hydrolase [Mycobacterium kubicae]|uniref:Alpha/beta hydrolase n=1 Tax=Mycobacterium kubicae TaxID=120959 RepID=A0AAX1JGC7_9MYCO|nr:alpha/beta hydrolase [Mycobacterium kubicae]ORV95884.1 alpha/beta hydrolase [Mycobacterium kubicae]QNI14665.1 alpha/beta hydrolase [Mycobacterium kubicae]QPI40584.1 alpha/beta hydrolase [Mycobacterium kubicae]